MSGGKEEGPTVPRGATVALSRLRALLHRVALRLHANSHLQDLSMIHDMDAISFLPESTFNLS